MAKNWIPTCVDGSASGSGIAAVSAADKSNTHVNVLIVMNDIETEELEC